MSSPMFATGPHVSSRKGSGEGLREGTVDWTPNLRIRSGGLEVSDRKRGTTFVEWRQISKMELNEGMIELGVGNHVKPLLRTTSAGPNFFPAYSLAQRLWQRSRS